MKKAFLVFSLLSIFVGSSFVYAQNTNTNSFNANMFPFTINFTPAEVAFLRQLSDTDLRKLVQIAQQVQQRAISGQTNSSNINNPSGNYQTPGAQSFQQPANQIPQPPNTYSAPITNNSARQPGLYSPTPSQSVYDLFNGGSNALDDVSITPENESAIQRAGREAAAALMDRTPVVLPTNTAANCMRSYGVDVAGSCPNINDA